MGKKKNNNATIALKHTPQIIDGKNLNAYGVLLHTRKSIEEFQQNSGMDGRYTKEYQHHYWSANARLSIDEQILDISIPLIMFNYEQTVTGGDIKFDLVEVEKVSNALQEAAIAKYKELQETEIYKYITEKIGITDWKLYPLNTAHVHPGGQNQAFSGIDTRKDANYPGVVYPLSKGEYVPSFSAIMAHIDGICRTVHSEYRLFNESKNGNKVYAHGRCATIVKGFEPEPLPRVEQPEPTPQRMIDKIFNIEPEQPKQVEQKEAPERESFILRNQMEKEAGEEFLAELAEAWEKTDYAPDTTMIVKENIKSGYVANNTWNNKKKTQGNSQGDKDVSFFDQKKIIVDEEIATWTELNGKTVAEVEALYTLALICIEENVGTEDDLSFGSENVPMGVRFYQFQGLKYTIDEIVKMRIILKEDTDLHPGRIDTMSDFNVISYYETFYNTEGD